MMIEFLESLRKIDLELGGNCRVNITVGGAVGTAPNEDSLPEGHCALSVFLMDTGNVVVFVVSDDEWEHADMLARQVIDYIQANLGNGEVVSEQ